MTVVSPAGPTPSSGSPLSSCSPQMTLVGTARDDSMNTFSVTTAKIIAKNISLPDPLSRFPSASSCEEFCSDPTTHIAGLGLAGSGRAVRRGDRCPHQMAQQCESDFIEPERLRDGGWMTAVRRTRRTSSFSATSTRTAAMSRAPSGSRSASLRTRASIGWSPMRPIPRCHTPTARTTGRDMHKFCRADIHSQTIREGLFVDVGWWIFSSSKWNIWYIDLGCLPQQSQADPSQRPSWCVFRIVVTDDMKKGVVDRSAEVYDFMVDLNLSFGMVKMFGESTLAHCKYASNTAPSKIPASVFSYLFH